MACKQIREYENNVDRKASNDTPHSRLAKACDHLLLLLQHAEQAAANKALLLLLSKRC